MWCLKNSGYGKGDEDYTGAGRWVLLEMATWKWGVAVRTMQHTVKLHYSGAGLAGTKERLKVEQVVEGMLRMMMTC